MGIKCEIERTVEIFYRNMLAGKHRLDLIVDDKVILELKAVAELHPAHQAQVISYLKAAGLKVAFLANLGIEKVEYKRLIL